jgi:leucyl-tRNA synthetase
MHLLYARFIHKFLRDIGMVNSDEPFRKLIHQGTITNQGAKMSKSKGNVVNPDDFIVNCGADVFRMYLMFMGPYELGGDWSDKGIVGVDRFVQRIFALVNTYPAIVKEAPAKDKYDLNELSEAEKGVYRKLNQTLEKVAVETEHFRFNTAVAALMELLNELSKNLAVCRKDLVAYSLERMIVMLAPLAPHLGEECWQIIGNEKSLFASPVWFNVDKAALSSDTMTIAVQVSGKLRSTIDLPAGSSQDDVKLAAWADEKIKFHTEGKTVVKEIYVPNRIYNIVVK